jgi:LPXTG-site transpeptidase (sortase) family protein
MNRIVSLLGGALVLLGVGILAYVGVSYAQSQQAQPKVPTWSAAQHQKARQLVSSLNTTQRITIPRTLRGTAKAARVRPGSEPGLRMVIAKIDVDAPILQTPPVGGVWNVADWAVGHLTTTPNPGAPGNAGYAAHDDIKGEIFKRVNELNPGDPILIYTRHAIYRYVVVNQQTVDPSNVSVLDPTSRPTITLVSCTPYWVDTQRLIVQAVLKSTTAR